MSSPGPVRSVCACDLEYVDRFTHHQHDTVQSRFPIPCRFSSTNHGHGTGRDFVQIEKEANSCCRYLLLPFHLISVLIETEKYAHVTFFFNGGQEVQFENEERILVASPKVATYDLKPEMSALEVGEKVAETVAMGKYDFVMCNFAPPDMVGHTGVYEAAIKGVEATGFHFTDHSHTLTCYRSSNWSYLGSM